LAVRTGLALLPAATGVFDAVERRVADGGSFAVRCGRVLPTVRVAATTERRARPMNKRMRDPHGEGVLAIRRMADP
jgi:hypothetical protein